MSNWDYSNVGIFFDQSKNNVKIVEQVMEILGLKSSEYLYKEDTGVDGPVWSGNCGDVELYYESAEDDQLLFDLLNTLFDRVGVYSVYAQGNSVLDFYSGKERTFDPLSGKIIVREFNYCYGEGTAFGKRVKSEYLSEAGSHCKECDIKHNNPMHIYNSLNDINERIADSKSDDYFECAEIIAQKMKELIDSSITEIIIEDGVLNSVSTFSKEFVIPGSVIRIGYKAFKDCRSLKSVTIPEGVTEIGYSAFKGCKSLKSVTIPDSVKKIDWNAFSGCMSLQSVTIPDGVTEIGYLVFKGCRSLQSVTIPDSVKTIGDLAFTDCTSLQSVTIPDGVKTIGASAFNGCTSLQSVIIPDSVKKIGDLAFSGCRSLQSVTIPDGVKEIGNDAFFGCNNLEITIPEKLSCNAEQSIFSGCKTVYGYEGKCCTTEPLPKEQAVTSIIRSDADIAHILVYQKAKIWNPVVEKHVNSFGMNGVLSELESVFASNNEKKAEFSKKIVDFVISNVALLSDDDLKNAYQFLSRNKLKGGIKAIDADPFLSKRVHDTSNCRN